MSLYGAIHGEHAEGGVLIKILEVAATGPFTVGRYRDAWVEAHGDVPTIRVHTRNGGGNREWMAEAIESMQAHPWYVRDEDDDFDSTYADFYFVPRGEMGDDVLPALVMVAGAPVDMGARWQAAIDAIGR